MNNFFKLSVIAAAVALSGTATAGTFTGNGTTITANENAVIFSSQGVAVTGVAAALQVGPVVSYKLGAAYIVGDELILTFANAMSDKSVLPTTIMVDTAEFNLISNDYSIVKYRVVAGSAQAGSTFVVPQSKVTAADIANSAVNGLVFSTSSLVGNTVVASATKNNGTDSHDADTSKANSNILALSVTQFGSAKLTESANAVIDSALAAPSTNTAFVTGVNDSISFSYAAPTVMPTKALLGVNDGVNDLTASKVAPVLTVVAALTADYTAANFTYASTVAGAVIDSTTTAGTITVTYPEGTTVPSDTFTITPKTGASAAEIKPVTFTAGVASNTATPLAATAAGSWTNPGQNVITVPYMPYGSGLSQVIYATNESTSDAEVSVVAVDESGTSYKLGVVATAKASSVTKLATAIKNSLAAEGFTSGKLSLEITFRGTTGISSDGQVMLHTGYNANATDRGFVTNTSNGSL